MWSVWVNEENLSTFPTLIPSNILLQQVCASLLLSTVNQLIFVGALETRFNATVLPELVSMLEELLTDKETQTEH